MEAGAVPCNISTTDAINWDTLPETNTATNIALENRPPQKEIHLPTIDFQVLC